MINNALTIYMLISARPREWYSFGAIFLWAKMPYQDFDAALEELIDLELCTMKVVRDKNIPDYYYKVV